MLKKEITYTDFNGIEQTEVAYFNLTKSELVDMETSGSGSYKEHLQAIVDAKDTYQIMHEMKQLILLAYGKKSEDGKRFIKSKEDSEEFAQTAAYDAIFWDLCQDDSKAADFVKSVLPSDLQEYAMQNHI